MFINALNETLNERDNISITENGAVGYKTSGKKLVDLNFAVSSLRDASEDEIIKKFKPAFCEEPILALKWLFFARDIREGLGERRLFRTIFLWIANNYPLTTAKLLPYIEEYGRFDDLLILFNSKAKNSTVAYIRDKIIKDLQLMKEGKPCSLIAKWLPSENASSRETRALARELTDALHLTAKEYRKTLSALRKHINVLESQITANEWSTIDYEAVPSKANLKYAKAFLRHDEIRRRQFLANVSSGITKINSSVNYPHDIVHKYTDPSSFWGSKALDYEETLEVLWKNLKRTNEIANTIVVRDGSGSMGTTVGNASLTAMEVATALAIYFAESCSGEFKDRFITFSANPRLVDLSNYNSLKSKLDAAYAEAECSNTDIEAVFNLILDTAITHQMKQEDLPERILILSDMEFDAAQSSYWSSVRTPVLNKKLFDIIKQKYEEAGYKLPKLIFWNICGRTETIPIKENDFGVALVSGFSTNIVSMLLSNKTDPFEILKETLESPRYAFIDKVVEDVSELETFITKEH